MSNQLLAQLKHRWPLTIFFIVVALSLIVPILREKPQPRVSHIPASSTQHLEVLWVRNDVSPCIAVGGGTVYVVPLTWDSLIALNPKTGSTLWEVKLPFERSGVRGLLADTNTVYIVNSTHADAYEAKTGKPRWSTELGKGHVEIIPQLDSGLLRVYYGNQILEIDPATGEILKTRSKDSIVWLSGNVVLKNLSDKSLTAVDSFTGKPLWTTNGMRGIFYVREDIEPQSVGTSALLVSYKDKRICALDLQIGKDKWCRHEAYITRVALDKSSNLGYVLRNDLVLVTLDLDTGNVLGETTFLSSEPSTEQFSYASSAVFSDGVVVITFNDSSQTFGLRLSNASE